MGPGDYALFKSTFYLLTYYTYVGGRQTNSVVNHSVLLENLLVLVVTVCVQ